jgi:hypothetical protein
VGPFADGGSPAAAESTPVRRAIGAHDLAYAAALPVVAADSAPTAAPDPYLADERTLAIASFLRGTPLEAHAAAMAAADRHAIDWRLLPVISVLESGGGVAACGGNAWGYARCDVRFASFQEGIPVVAATLASYGRYDSATLLCIWVSGGGCHSRHAIAYTHRAAYLYTALGGTLAVRALPPEPPLALPPVEGDPVVAAAPPDPQSTDPPPPTPGASPTPGEPPPSDTPAPEESPTPPPEGAES